MTRSVLPTEWKEWPPPRKAMICYHTNIRHQELVRILGSRNLYLRLVYAHIANYTQVKGAWCGSQRDLAAQLELPIGTINNQLTELINKGLIVRDVNKYRSLGELPNLVNEHSCSVGEQKRSAHEQQRSADEQKRSADEQNPDSIINNNMEKNEKNARANMRDANPVNNPSFEELLNAFKAKAGNYQIADSVLSDARRIWSSDQYPEWKRRLLIRRINEGKWLKSRFDWTLTDFDPKPEFLSGVEQEENWRLNIPMVQVKVNGSYRICTLETQQDFALPFIQPWLKKED